MAKMQNIKEYAEDVANRVMDQVEIEGKTLREWVRLIVSEEWAPVIHARWYGTEYNGYSDENPVFEVYQCSNCGAEFRCSDMDFDYCPRCGAKMEQEEEDGQDNN